MNNNINADELILNELQCKSINKHLAELLKVNINGDNCNIKSIYLTPSELDDNNSVVRVKMIFVSTSSILIIILDSNGYRIQGV